MWLKKDVLTKTDKADFKIAIVVVVIFSVFVYWLMFRNSGKAEVDLEKDLKVSTTDKPSNDFVKSNSNKLAIIGKEKLQPLSIKAEDAYEVNIDSAVVISDAKQAVFLETKKTVQPENIESKVTDVSEVKKEEVSELNDSLIEAKETISEEIDDNIGSSNADNEISENSNSESTIDSKSESINDAESAVITEVSNSIDENDKENATSIVTKVEETVKEKISEPIETKQETVVANESFDCVIVVGAFREAGNKEAVIDKLKSLGHAHSEGVLRGGLNYVGVPVSCNDKKQKRKLLNELNEAFNIDSWVKKK